MHTGRERVVVVSPHFDDGVFGCGDLLARSPGSTVITVFAAVPPPSDTLTPWDEAAGFRKGDDVVAARREEDRAALRCLDAAAVWLPFCDSQYGDSVRVKDIADALEAAIRETSIGSVFIPFGLFHADHDLTHRAALMVRERQSVLAWFAYAEAIYRRIPGLCETRLRALPSAAPFQPRPDNPAGADAKRQAVACYASQLRALSTLGHELRSDILEPERYWTL